MHIRLVIRAAVYVSVAVWAGPLVAIIVAADLAIELVRSQAERRRLQHVLTEAQDAHVKEIEERDKAIACLEARLRATSIRYSSGPPYLVDRPKVMVVRGVV